MVLKTILDYWAQLSLLLFGVAYFVKFFVDRKGKRQDIMYELFYTRKLECYIEFYHFVSSYYDKTARYYDQLLQSGFDEDKESWDEITVLFKRISDAKNKSLGLARIEEKAIFNEIDSYSLVIFDFLTYFDDYSGGIVNKFKIDDFLFAHKKINELLDQLSETSYYNR